VLARAAASAAFSLGAWTSPMYWERPQRISTRQDRSLVAFRAVAIFLLGGVPNR
jgi:hypothetical protein